MKTTVWLLRSQDVMKNNFDMSFTDFSNRMLNGFSTDYAAYEVTKKYQKFVMKQFFK